MDSYYKIGLILSDIDFKQKKIILVYYLLASFMPQPLFYFISILLSICKMVILSTNTNLSLHSGTIKKIGAKYVLLYEQTAKKYNLIHIFYSSTNEYF